LEKFRESTETYTIAYNWLRNRRVIYTSFTIFSPSGDWAKYVYSYFREDGTLAKVEVDYRTFQGDLIILQNLYFDRAGKILKKTTKFKDLSTRKLKNPSKEYLRENSALLNEVDYYRKNSLLPYAGLLKK
jgi:hypothetical protein